MASYNAGTGTAVTHYGQGDLVYGSNGSITRNLNGNSWTVNPTDEKYNSIYNEYVQRYGMPSTPQTTQPPAYTAPDTSALEAKVDKIASQLETQTYTPVDVEEKLAKTMGYDEAYQLAKSIVEPQYTKTYQQAADVSAQNLEKAGLYDSLYGQTLQTNAMNNVSQDMNAAIGNLALELQNMDYDKAVQMANLMINENQFGANYNQNGLSTAAGLYLDRINSAVDHAKLSNDFALEAAQLALQQQAQYYENLYYQGKITGQELENKLLELELKSEQKKSGGSGGSGTGNDDYNEIVSKQQAMKEAGYPVTVDGIWGSESQKYWELYQNGGSNQGFHFQPRSSKYDNITQLVDSLEKGSITEAEAKNWLKRMNYSDAEIQQMFM